MAILFSQADGSDQHYDTYEEFEQALILIKRLNGEKVPQDLLDEVKAKIVRSEPVQFEINGKAFEDLISSAAEPLGKDVNGDKEPKYEVGDRVKVVNNLSVGHPEGTVGVIDSVSYDSDEGTHTYGVDPKRGSLHNVSLFHDESELETAEDSPTEFRPGDVVLVTETFKDSYGDSLFGGDLHRFGKLNSGRVCISSVFVDGDNLDKLRLVCRREDRKDIKL